MLIYLLLLIPIVATIICFIFFKHHVVWWEYLLNFGAAVICIFAAKAIIEHTQVTDNEYWGGWIKEVRYYEDWNEYIHRTCSSTCCCDSKGNNCQTTYYDCSYVDYHSEYYIAKNSNGKTFNISKSKYKKLVRQFGTDEIFHDLNRNYHTNDGDMYVASWDGNVEKIEPTVRKYSYENRVRVSSSTFAMKEPPVDIFEQYGLFHYPKIYDQYKQIGILGYDDARAERKLQMVNATLGAKYEIKTFIMVFKNQPREAGLYQEDQWQGGNKNELNITIGIDENNNVTWCHVFSWTDERDIVVELKNYIEGQGNLNLSNIINKIYPMVKEKWVRKNFSDFSYLTVEPETKHIIVAFIVTLLVNIGVTMFVVFNDITEEDRRRRYN